MVSFRASHWPIACVCVGNCCASGILPARSPSHPQSMSSALVAKRFFAKRLLRVCSHSDVVLEFLGVDHARQWLCLARSLSESSRARSPSCRHHSSGSVVLVLLCASVVIACCRRCSKGTGSYACKFKVLADPVGPILLSTSNTIELSPRSSAGIVCPMQIQASAHVQAVWLAYSG